MKNYQFIYLSCLLLIGITACQDELFQPLMEENETPVVQENEIFLKREYAEYILTVEKLAGLEGCRIRVKEGFVFLSDSIVRSGEPLTIEVEQNPYEEERLSELEFTDREGTVVRSFSLHQASSLSQTQGEAYSGALQRSYGVGYGYDAFGEYASYNSVRDQVISLPALRRYEQENRTSCIVDDFAPDMETTIMEGADSEQLLKSLSAHAGLGLDVGFFQAHVEGKYSRSDLKTNAYSFCTIMNNYKAASRHVDPYSLVEVARNNPNILTEGFRHIINKICDAQKDKRLDKVVEYTEELFRVYGTHIIYHADLGGKLEFCSTFERAALDSKTTLSIAAEASFLNMCGFKMEEGQTNSYSQTSTRQSRSISARGGDVACITEILNNDKDVLESGLVDNWYRTINLDFNDPKKSNVELTDFKLFPIYEFINNVEVKSFVASQLDTMIDYEDSMFPRVYDKIYTKIHFNNSIFSDTNRGAEYLILGDQAIIETVSEYIRIGEKQYKLRSLYPILAGEVRHEGVAVASDSLFIIRWNRLDCTLIPLGKRSEYPVLYYNNGDLGFMPDESVDNYSNYSGTPQTMSFYSWKGTYDKIYKYGPLLLMIGPEAYNLSYNAEDRKKNPDYHVNVLADRPVGWEMVTIDNTIEALKELHKKYNIKERDKGLQNNGIYYIYNNTTDKTLYKFTYKKSEDFSMSKSDGYFSYRYPLLYVRSASFRY